MTHVWGQDLISGGSQACQSQDDEWYKVGWLSSFFPGLHIYPASLPISLELRWWSWFSSQPVCCCRCWWIPQPTDYWFPLSVIHGNLCGLVDYQWLCFYVIHDMFYSSFLWCCGVSFPAPLYVLQKTHTQVLHLLRHKLLWTRAHFRYNTCYLHLADISACVSYPSVAQLSISSWFKMRRETLFLHFSLKILYWGFVLAQETRSMNNRSEPET